MHQDRAEISNYAVDCLTSGKTRNASKVPLLSAISVEGKEEVELRICKE